MLKPFNEHFKTRLETSGSHENGHTVYPIRGNWSLPSFIREPAKPNKYSCCGKAHCHHSNHRPNSRVVVDRRDQRKRRIYACINREHRNKHPN